MEKDKDEILQLQISDDDFYKEFLTSITKSSLTQSLSITEQVKKLAEGIDFLNRELQKQVLDKHDDLLRQAKHATKMENVLNTMNVHVQNLLSNAERLKMQITIPCNTLELHTQILGRMHLASHILRQVNRIQQLSNRLSHTSDPVQKASILHELEQLASDPDLKDIDIVTAELRNIRSQQQKVIKLANGSLNQGITNQNATQTTTALQIFINLGSIKATTTSFVEQNLIECRECLRAALDANTESVGPNQAKGSKGPGKIMTLTTSQGFRSKVWLELEKLFSEDLFQICQQIKFLQITLDSLNNIPNFDNSNVASNFWKEFEQVFQHELKKSSSAVVQMLEEDYPKLLKYYFELTKKLSYDQFHFNSSILDQYENSFLSSSLTQMLDPAQAMFNLENNYVPKQDNIDGLLRIISNELSVALIEESLSLKISKNISKCIKMFAVKTEQQLETGSEAAQVIGNVNAGQQKNVQLANNLFYLQLHIQRMLNNMKESLPLSSAEVINDSLVILQRLVAAIIQPLVDSINSVIETIIVTIHLETDWAKLQAPLNKTITSCSPYMKELTQFINRVYNMYLASFENSEVVSKKCSEIATRCIELQVRHSSLLRPITLGGRLRLQLDYSHLEHALKSICPHLVDLGRPYRLLKSMATLVTLSAKEIVQSQVSSSSVPHSTILLMLFSYAGNELASPYQNIGWSLQKLSVWLDEHPNEGDRLDLIRGALQRYESTVRQNNSVNYDAVYPIMSQFLEDAFKSL